MDGMRGSAGRFKGASAGISASAPEFGRPASVSAGIAGSVASARRGGDEAGRRGPRVSGGAHCERAERATRSRADAAGRAARWAGAGGAGWAERLIGPSALGRAGVTGWAAGKKEPLGFAGGSKLGRGEREKRAGPRDWV